MDPLIVAALARTLKKQKSDLTPGKHTVDAVVTLTIHGTVTVGESTFYRPTASIPLKSALALFMRYSGVTGPAAMNALVRAMSEAVTTPEAELREIADLEAAEAQVRAGLERLPLAPRAGAVKVDVKVSELRNVRKVAA